MVAAAQDLTPWLTRVKKAATRSEVFSILDEFRKLEWSDAQRAMMAKLYVRTVERLSDDSSQVEAAPAAEQHDEDNGPVWYEKM